MKQRNAGFTIVELMIATSVFAVVLLVMSVSILQLSRLYFKGITSSETQDTARSLMNAVSQAIQLSPGSVIAPTQDSANNNLNPTAAGDYYLCADTQQFSYHFGQQVVDGKHGVVLQHIGGGCAAGPPLALSSLTTLPSGATELLGDHMRLANLTVSQLSLTSYRIVVRVVYGDADLLCSTAVTDTSDAASCGSSASLTEDRITGGGGNKLTLGQLKQLQCKNVSSGGQFCAEAELSTIVQRRVN